MAESGRYTAEAFAVKMDAFIAFCENEGVDATDYQLIKFFDISPTMLENYRLNNKLNEGSDYESDGFDVSLKKLDLYREDATIRQVVSDPKLASHCSLKLRQPHWGRWSDKSDAARDIGFRVNIGNGDRELTE
ncbi:MAG: hypothetical protein GX847_12750 [Clostridiales bacterium]|nr:hypothetical protein [Clostridiales bacterium]